MARVDSARAVSALIGDPRHTRPRGLRLHQVFAPVQCGRVRRARTAAADTHVGLLSGIPCMHQRNRLCAMQLSVRQSS
jgi:hypothetical protein